MATQPFVSVIVPTYNRREIIKDCLESLFNQTYSHDRYEIIVVNDGSTDGTDDLLKTFSARTGFAYFNQKNMGPGAARNLGIEKSKGEIICFIDDDCLADKDWIRNMVDSYSDDAIAGVGGKIISYKPETLIERYLDVLGLMDQEKFIEVFAITANASFRKEMLKKINCFDVQLKNGEDADLGIRIKVSGWRLVYNKNAIVHHKHRTTLKGFIKQQYTYGLGYAFLHKKYSKNFNPEKQIVIYSRTALKDLIRFPFIILKSFLVKDRIFYLSKRSLDILLVVSYTAGLFFGAYSGKAYTGEKVNSRLEFMDKINISDGWGL